MKLIIRHKIVLLAAAAVELARDGQELRATIGRYPLS